MCEEIWQQVAGEGRLLGAATLEGYARYQLRGEDYPGIVKESGKVVAGKVYTELSPSALAKLDLFEGDDYTRISVQVTLNDMRVMQVMTYAMTAAASSRLSRHEWDYESFRRQGKQRFMQRYMGFQRE